MKLCLKFYDYIVVAELAENPYTAPPAVNTANISLYFNEENIWKPRTAPWGRNILTERIGS